MSDSEGVQKENSPIKEDEVLSTPGTFARDDDAWLREVEQVVRLAGAHD